jgi:hypothetical protein
VIKLRLKPNKDSKAVPCGCTFTYAGGFVYVCEPHKAAQKARKLRAAKPMRFDMLGAVKNREPFSHVAQEPTKGGAIPKASPAFHGMVEEHTTDLLAARSEIRKPSSKLTRSEREHLHTFAFSAETIRKSLRISKKHPA